MNLDNSQLQAFKSCAETESVTKAATYLGLTQSALSQKIKRLEEKLGCTLFIRQKSGLSLTEQGSKLLRYSLLVEGLEQEAIADIDAYQKELSGTLRVAAFSSVLRSCVIPALTPFLLKHPKVNCEFSSHEVKDLESILTTGKADWVIADYSFQKSGIEEKVLGQENYVVINSKKNPCNEEIYLDHGAHDNATSAFFSQQKNRPKYYRRTFMGDVYGIIEGVESGLGKAVMSEHLIEKNKNIQIQKGHKKYQRDIVLHHFAHPYYPKLWKLLQEELSKGF